MIGLSHLLTAPDLGLDIDRIEMLYSALTHEVYSQLNGLIEQSKVVLPPRSAKVLLAEVAKGAPLSPDLLDEIKRRAESKPKD